MTPHKHVNQIIRDFTEPAGGGGGGRALHMPDSEYRAVTSAGADGRILLNGDIEIFPGKPMEGLSSFETRGFEARDLREGRALIALTTGRHSSARTTDVGSYQNIRNPHLLKLVTAGIVDWPGDGKQVYTFVFDQPPARRLMAAGTGRTIRIHEDRIVPAIIQPLASVLSDLRNVDLVHGGITAENIFIAGGEGAEMAILGEGLSSAAFFRLGAVYETVERAMAQPSGRGPGTIKNDLYALGICVAMVLRGGNPLAGKSAAEVIQHKIDNGSYAALMGGERLPSHLGEFLRGVLHDDEAARWGVDDVMRWLEGRRLSAKQSYTMMKARRPFVFRERKFWELRTLGMALASYPADAAALMEKDTLDVWVKRNFDDQELEQRIDKLRGKEEGALRERVVSDLVQSLDPRAPVRYKGLALFPEGFGTALADAIARGEDIQPYAEMVALQLFNSWASQRYSEIPDAGNIISQFEKCRNFLAQKMPGYGIERVLYMLNKEVVCLSPVFRDFYVLGPGHLLLALERIAQRGTPLETILDRHMVAFISVRDPKSIDPFLGHIISHDRAYQVIGVLRALSSIQKRFRIAPVPALTRMLVPMMGAAVERFYDHDLRQEILKKLVAAGEGGSLSALLDLVDAPPVVQDDQLRYARARHEYALLARERMQLDAQLARRGGYGLAAGRQVAMLVSSVIGLTAVVVTLLHHYFWR